MKRRGTTIEGVALTPHWLGGYAGELNGRKVVVRQESARDWFVRQALWGFPWRAIGGGRTLRDAVKMAKEAGL